MKKPFDRKGARAKRHRRVRTAVTGSELRPRLAVFRSLHHIYAQIIDDGSGRTLAASSTVDLKLAHNDLSSAVAVGKTLAERAKAQGISAIVFDRGGFLYHGRVKALAEAAREAGLEF